MDNLKPAMRGHNHSKLLIIDNVLPDRNPSPQQCLMDMNMMTLAGKERSEKQWHILLKQAGFEILKIYEGKANMRLIEAALKEE